MTGSSRPNLGGLFNGTVPPERARRINGAPTLAVAPMRPESSTPTEKHETPAPSAPDWLDPIKAVEQYFAVLRALLDVNRDVAVAVTRVLLSLPQRVGLRR